jgi:hypothetical protein
MDGVFDLNLCEQTFSVLSGDRWTYNPRLFTELLSGFSLTKKPVGLEAADGRLYSDHMLSPEAQVNKSLVFPYHKTNHRHFRRFVGIDDVLTPKKSVQLYSKHPSKGRHRANGAASNELWIGRGIPRSMEEPLQLGLKSSDYQAKRRKRGNLRAVGQSVLPPIRNLWKAE